MKGHMKKIIVLGAGPTGLGAAYRLHEIGYENWNIYEKNHYVGGLSASFKDKQGFTWDIGGHIIFSNNDRFNRLLDNVLYNEALTFKRESWIWLKDSFIQYPFQNNFHTHPDKELVFECVSGLFDVLHKKGSYKNFEEWIYHFFGEGIARYFMIPYNNKVWACPLNKMDYNWIAERVSIIDLKRILKNIISQKDDSDWGPNNTFRYPLFGGTGGLFHKFLPHTHGHLSLKKNAVKIASDRKEVIFEDGEKTSYDVLITTIPLTELLDKMEDKPDWLGRSAEEFFWNRGYMVGIGIKKPCPSNKNWIYFPGNDSPFYRVTYLSNYSPNMTPKGEFFSFLAETSYSRLKTVSKETIVEETIQGLINSKLLQEEDRSLITSIFLIDVPYSFPIPFLGRDNAVKNIQSFLSERKIYSRGRFGGWKYEVGNMDHSVMQGMEIVDKILLDKEETVYKI
ncbi:MAG: amine oxidase [Candidatus Brocadia sp. WS118]|nr:MAG: amine oxidase [Candidatus Brocadia sp. WS118]